MLRKLGRVLIPEKEEKAVLAALVTGGTGFIGTHLVKKLISEGLGVRVLVRPHSVHADRLKGVGVDIVEGDLEDAEALYEAAKGINIIIHAARAKTNDRNKNYENNIKGTEYLVKASLAHEVERFVQISDIEVYKLQNVRKGLVIKEDSPLQENPRDMNSYTYAKIESEKLLFGAYREQGLAVTVVRPGMVVGPMGQIFFPHLGYRFQNKLFFLVGKGSNVLPLTYIDNMVDGIYRASIEEKAVGQIYNFVDDPEITVRSYVEQLIQITGVKARIVPLPYTLPYVATTAYELAGHVGLLKKGVTSRSQFRWKHAPVRFDNSKAKNDLSWVPQVPLREGLARTFKWYAESTVG